MGFLGGLFNDVVKIATVPLKVGARVVDRVTDSDLEDLVDDLRDAIEVDED